MDYTNVFTNLNLFPTRDALQAWIRRAAIEHNMVIVIKRPNNENGKKKAHIILAYERGEEYQKFKGRGRKLVAKNKKKPDDKFDEDEKKENVKGKKDTRTKKCGCSFNLKRTQVSPNYWRLEVKNGIHNHPVAIYLESHSYVGRLTKEKEDFVIDMSKCNTQPKNVLMMLKKRNANNHSTIHIIYNVRKKHREIRSIVSVAVLERLLDEAKRIESEYLELGKAIPVESVDHFWRKLDIEPMLKDEVDADVAEDMDSHLRKLSKVCGVSTNSLGHHIKDCC
ncbi:hypothetical protein ACS0TY_023606 [Phlomoides rotata]